VTNHPSQYEFDHWVLFIAIPEDFDDGCLWLAAESVSVTFVEVNGQVLDMHENILKNLSPQSIFPQPNSIFSERF